LRDQDLGQAVQDLNGILFRKNVVIDMDLDTTLAKKKLKKEKSCKPQAPSCKLDSLSHR
jgi:hypothetical protein